MLVSVVIPAHNERGAIATTVTELEHALTDAAIEHELVVVNDHSSDDTWAVLQELARQVPTLRPVDNDAARGFGQAVVAGIEASRGDAVAIFMADGSDVAADLVRFVRTMEEQGVDCVFGSRFIRGGKVEGYPLPKLILNRCANAFIRTLFGLRYNDITNAFKLYRRHVLDGLRPFLSPHFNLTVELPLKAIIRGYSYAVVPNSWIGRDQGVSKFRVREMGSRYAFIVLYCLLEKLLSRGDYRKERR